jgi:hypothetical protein
MTVTHTGITIQQKEKNIESYNSKGQLIHIIEHGETSNKIAIHRWFGSVTNEEIKEIFDGHFYAFLEREKIKKILVDTSKMSNLFDGVNDWLAQYYIPKLLKTGVKYNAFLLSEEFYLHLATDDLDEGIETPFVTHMFGSEDKALQWLKSIK